MRILFSIFFFWTSLAFAQTFPFQHYSVQDGLPQSNVSSVVQDKKGFLWIGTESGLSRFDGIHFVNFSSADGLADSRISALFIDKDNRLWIGHENGMISVRDKDVFIKSLNHLDCKKIFSIIQDKKGRIWLSTASKGAVCIEDASADIRKPGSFKVFMGKEGLSELVLDIKEDNKGRLFFFTNLGVKVQKENGSFEFAPRLPGVFPTAILIDKDNDLWYGTALGTLVHYNYKTASFKQYGLSEGLPAGKVENGFPVNFFSALFEDRDGNIWGAIWDKGIFRLDRKADQIQFIDASRGLSVNKIKAINQDAEGNLLFGTSGGGLSIFRSERFISYNQNNGLVNNQVWAIEKDNEGNFWFGTNEGISILNPATKQLSSLPGLEKIATPYVKAIKNDRLGNMWIGTWGGSLVKYDMRTKTLSRVNLLSSFSFNHISCLSVSKNGALWIGTPLGLVKYDENENAVSSFTQINGLSENDITTLYHDKNDNLWIGTKQSGICKYDGQSFKKFSSAEGLTFGSITGIAEGKNNRLWITTEGGGIFIYDGSRFINTRQKDGLVSDYTTVVASDRDGNMWIGSNNGLSRFNYSTARFLTYGVAEGFTGIETKPNAIYFDDQNRFWFGTVKGVFCFDPSKDKKNTVSPVTMITRLRINQKDYGLDSLLTLDYKENSLNVDFIGISLTNPEGVRYAVKLDGYDETWKPLTSQPFEVYSNLPPGDYSFNVLAYNSEGVPSEKPVAFRLSILPPFWKTWWFYVGCAFSGLIMIVGYVKFREKKLKTEKRLLEEKVRERTVEVTHKNRELAEKNKDIMDSIRYAKRIQDAILPPDEFVRKSLPKTFVLFKPKDIVSGDFYWLADKGDFILFAAVDCTGHGVPGAFMSIVGHNLLEQIVHGEGLTSPSLILETLNKGVSDTLRQSYTEDEAIKDGMDMTLCAFNRITKEFRFASAMNPLYFIREGQLQEIKGDKFPIGNLKVGEERKFTEHRIQLQKGDTIYIFSDGFADQFGGPNGKKFKYSQFKELLLSIQEKSMEEQGDILHSQIEKWRGELEQIDDILVIGTRL